MQIYQISPSKSYAKYLTKGKISKISPKGEKRQSKSVWEKKKIKLWTGYVPINQNHITINVPCRWPRKWIIFNILLFSFDLTFNYFAVGHKSITSLMNRKVKSIDLSVRLFCRQLICRKSGRSQIFTRILYKMIAENPFV